MLLAHGNVAPEPSSASVLGAWPFEPLVWLGIGVAGWWYLRAYARVPSYHSVRRIHWLIGLGVVALALASPVAVYEGSLFWVHMAQHLLLTMVAAPLLVLGAPVTLALRASSPATRRPRATSPGSWTTCARPMRTRSGCTWCSSTRAMFGG